MVRLKQIAKRFEYVSPLQINHKKMTGNKIICAISPWRAMNKHTKTQKPKVKRNIRMACKIQSLNRENETPSVKKPWRFRPGQVGLGLSLPLSIITINHYRKVFFS